MRRSTGGDEPAPARPTAAGDGRAAPAAATATAHGEPAADALVASVGERLRAERARQRISLRALARRVAISPSAVSQIERGQVMPSVGTLYALTSELGLSMDDVIGGEAAAADGHAPSRRLAAASLEGAAALAAPTLSAPSGQVVPHDERRVVTLASGVRWELLTSYEPGVEFLSVLYPAGSQSCEPDQLIRHEGSERGVVLRGRLGVTLGAEHHELGPGDAIAFRSETPHRLWAVGDEPAAAIWFITGRNGGARG